MAASDTPLVSHPTDSALQFEVWEGVGRGGKIFLRCAGPLRISLAASGSQVFNIGGTRYVFDQLMDGDFTRSWDPDYRNVTVVMKPAPPERGFSKPTNPNV